MRLTPSQYAETLVALSEEASDMKRVAASFLLFLRKNRALKKLPAVLALYEKMVSERTGRKDLLVETAFEPVLSTKVSIESMAKSAFPGKDCSFRYAVNPDFLGGARVSSDDEMIDATIRRRLNELEKTMR